MNKQRGMYPDIILDIEVYRYHGDGYWAQAPFLVHGFDDVLWTDDIDVAVAYIKECAEKTMKGEE